MERNLSPSEHVSPPDPAPMFEDGVESGFAGYVTKVYIVGSRSPIFVAGMLVEVKRAIKESITEGNLGMVSLSRVNKHGETQETVVLMVEHIAGLSEIKPDEEISDVTIQD